MNKDKFYDNLNNNTISEIEIVYFSQNANNLFEDFKIDNKNLREKTENILENLGKYLPCSFPIIEEYFKKFYGFPKIKNDPYFLIIYSELLDKGAKNYKAILENIGYNFQEDELYKKYMEHINLYNEQKKNFKDILSLEEKDREFKKEIERLSSENRILENEEIGDLEKISNTLEQILKLDEESKNIIKFLEERDKNG